MTSISKNVYIDKLDDIVENAIMLIIHQLKWNLLMLKIIHVLMLKKEINDKNPKFKIGDYVRISKYKNIFAKGYMPNWSEETFFIKKIKNIVPWTLMLKFIYLIMQQKQISKILRTLILQALH